MNTTERELMPGMVAWENADGTVMAGRVVDSLYHYVQVIRVDGTRVYMDASPLRPATLDDVQSACDYFNATR